MRRTAVVALVAAAMLVAVACSEGSSDDAGTPADGATTSSAGGATTFTYESDWGTFTLGQDVYDRVQEKIANGEPLDIPLFTYVTGGDFPVGARLALEAEGPKLGIESQLIGPVEPNDAEVINNIESYLSRQPDAIAILPGDTDNFVGEVDKIAEMGIPVIAWNIDIPNSKRIAYIGPDNVKFGEQAGQLMVDKLNAAGVSSGTIQTFCIACTGGYAVDGRIPGFQKVVSAALPDIEYAEPVTVGAELSAAVSKVDAALRGKEDVVGLYTVDELVSASAVWAKTNGGMDTKSKYVIVGHNMAPNLLEFMADGYIDALTGQDPYGQATAVLTWLKEFLTTGETPCGPICITPLSVVESAEQAKELLANNCDGKGCA